MFQNINPKANIISSTEIPMQYGISKRIVFRSMGTGLIMAVTPSMSNILAALDPTTLPMATEPLPLTVPIMLTTISGIEVPMPTMVRPIRNSDML